MLMHHHHDGWRRHPKVFFIFFNLYASLLCASVPATDDGGVERNNQNVSNRTLDIYQVQPAPEIDGRGDDPCWREIEASGGFMKQMMGGQPAALQTALRAGYDAQCLYLLIQADQPGMLKTDMGPPPDTHDVIAADAQIMVQLDPGNRRAGFFQFAISPLGARQDKSHAAWLGFNPRWQAATRVEPDQWTVEMAIPWNELLEGDGYSGTPLTGDCWGFNVNRIEPSERALSQWSLTAGSVGNFGCLGRIYFREGRNGQGIGQVAPDAANTLRLGPGKLTFAAPDAPASMTAAYTLLHDGRLAAADIVPVTPHFVIPYHLADGGLWQMDLEIKAASQTVQIMRYNCHPPRIAQTLAEMNASLRSAAPRLDTLRHPARPYLRQTVQELAETAEDLNAALRTPRALSAAAWSNLVAFSSELQTQWRDVRLDINLIQLYPQDGREHRFIAGTVGPDVRVFPDTAPPAPWTLQVNTAQAGNEYESFQLLVYPFWEQLDRVNIRFTDLRGPQGTIKSGHLRWFRIDDVRMLDDHPLFGRQPPLQPDILMPGEPFQAAAGRAHRIWVDIYLPPGTPPGLYTGMALVESGEQVTQIPITTKAYGFDLPAKTSLEHNHWFFFYRWRQFRGNRIRYSPGLFDRHLRTLSRYRVPPYLMDGETLWPEISFAVDGQDNYRFDFTKLATYLDVAERHHARIFWASLGPGVLMPFHPNRADQVRVLDIQARQSRTMRTLVGDWLEQYQAGRAKLYDNPAYQDFLAQYVAFLRERGLLERSYFEIYDEANYKEFRWLEMLDHHAFLRQHVPDLRLMSYGATPFTSYQGRTAAGLLDLWAPHLFECENPELVAAIHSRRAQYGEKFWFYTCTERQGGGNHGWSPHVILGRPWLGIRLIPWFAWRFQTDGFFVYSLLTDIDKQNLKPAVDQRWPKSPWHAGYARGGGLLVYPGPHPDYDIIPSIRLAHLRDGLEDYEYFVLLRQRLEQADLPASSGTARQIRAALEPDPGIIRSVYDWTTDLERLNHKRDEIARLIIQLD